MQLRGDSVTQGTVRGMAVILPSPGCCMGAEREPFPLGLPQHAAPSLIGGFPPPYPTPAEWVPVSMQLAQTELHHAAVQVCVLRSPALRLTLTSMHELQLHL